MAVGAPDGVEARARVLPGDVIAAGDLDCADRGPGAVFSVRDGRAAALELGSAAAGVEIEIARDLGQRGRSVDLDHLGRDADRAVAVEVLVERRLERFEG